MGEPMRELLESLGVRVRDATEASETKTEDIEPKPKPRALEEVLAEFRGSAETQGRLSHELAEAAAAALAAKGLPSWNDCLKAAVSADPLVGQLLLVLREAVRTIDLLNDQLTARLAVYEGKTITLEDRDVLIVRTAFKPTQAQIDTVMTILRMKPGFAGRVLWSATQAEHRIDLEVLSEDEARSLLACLKARFEPEPPAPAEGAAA